MLNKKVSKSIQFDGLPDDTCRLMATWIISHLDVNGVFHGDPVMVRSIVFPRRVDLTAEQIEVYLQALESAGLIIRYLANGELWQWWPAFRDNQIGLRADRETPEYPPPTNEIQQDAGYLPDTCRKDADELPAEEKLSEEKSNITEGTNGADAPPANLNGWLELMHSSKNRPASLRWMFETLYPGRDPPDYGYLGRTAKTVGGAGRLAALLWQSQACRVDGDVLRYCMGIAKGNGRKSNLDSTIAAAQAFLEELEDGEPG